MLAGMAVAVPVIPAHANENLSPALATSTASRPVLASMAEAIPIDDATPSPTQYTVASEWPAAARPQSMPVASNPSPIDNGPVTGTSSGCTTEVQASAVLPGTTTRGLERLRL